MAELKSESQRRNYISNEKMHGKVTTREMLLPKYQIVSLAHDGISRFWPLAPGFIPKGLADNQKKAVERILNSRDFITLFRMSRETMTVLLNPVGLAWLPNDAAQVRQSDDEIPRTSVRSKEGHDLRIAVTLSK